MQDNRIFPDLDFLYGHAFPRRHENKNNGFNTSFRAVRHRLKSLLQFRRAGAEASQKSVIDPAAKQNAIHALIGIDKAWSAALLREGYLWFMERGIRLKDDELKDQLPKIFLSFKFTESLAFVRAVLANNGQPLTVFDRHLLLSVCGKDTIFRKDSSVALLFDSLTQALAETSSKQAQLLVKYLPQPSPT